MFPQNGQVGQQSEVDAVAERYARFAATEAPGRSEIYRQWAAGVAADADVQAVLARIPANRRQPPLVFAVTRLLGSGEPSFAELALVAARSRRRRRPGVRAPVAAVQ